MFLYSKNCFCIGSSLYDRCCIKRLDTVHIYYSCTDSLLFQKLCCCLCRSYHLAAGNDRNIASFTDHCCLIHLKWYISFFVNRVYCVTSNTYISWLFILEKCFCQFFCLKMITWDINSHIRNCRHCCDILCGMMAHSQCTVAYTAADSDEFYVGIGVGNIYLCLFIASCRKEAGR